MNREKLPRTYTTNQIAEMFRFHVNTIRLHIQKGNIHAVKVGKVATREAKVRGTINGTLPVSHFTAVRITSDPG